MTFFQNICLGIITLSSFIAGYCYSQHQNKQEDMNDNFHERIKILEKFMICTILRDRKNEVDKEEEN